MSACTPTRHDRVSRGTPRPSPRRPPRLRPRIPAADVSASITVFLIAVPMALGLSLAVGAPLEAGLEAAAVGGIVAGLFGGAPLQVSGPSAGLTVVTAELIQIYGWRTTCAITIGAGLLQILLSTLRVARKALAVSPAIVHGTLAGIGVAIALAQLHIMLGRSPQSSVVANALALPSQLAVTGGAAPLIGALTVAVVLLWLRLPGRAGRTARRITADPATSPTRRPPPRPTPAAAPGPPGATTTATTAPQNPPTARTRAPAATTRWPQRSSTRWRCCGSSPSPSAGTPAAVPCRRCSGASRRPVRTRRAPRCGGGCGTVCRAWSGWRHAVTPGHGSPVGRPPTRSSSSASPTWSSSSSICGRTRPWRGGSPRERSNCTACTSTSVRRRHIC